MVEGLVLVEVIGSEEKIDMYIENLGIGKICVLMEM